MTQNADYRARGLKRLPGVFAKKSAGVFSARLLVRKAIESLSKTRKTKKKFTSKELSFAYGQDIS